jgi:NhaP-type Na+/H+ or K+/H+ antiporter
MNTVNDSTTPQRTGLRRVIPPWEFRHLRFWGGLRIGGGVVVAVCFFLTLALGGNDARTYAWAGAFLAVALLLFAAGSWELSIARSTS